jgi:hypothetical protein
MFLSYVLSNTGSQGSKTRGHVPHTYMDVCWIAGPSVMQPNAEFDPDGACSDAIAQTRMLAEADRKSPVSHCMENVIGEFIARRLSVQKSVGARVQN